MSLRAAPAAVRALLVTLGTAGGHLHVQALTAAPCGGSVRAVGKVRRSDIVDEIWTSGTWSAKPGREAEFVEAWREFATWTALTQQSSRRAWLMRDADRPGVFVSMGPWPNAAAIDAWRADPGFGERVGRMRALLDGFEARTLVPVLELLESGDVVAR